MLGNSHARFLGGWTRVTASDYPTTRSGHGLFAGSLRSGKRAAAIMRLIQSTLLNGHDPYAYLKGILTRLPTQRVSDSDELLPYKWTPV